MLFRSAFETVLGRPLDIRVTPARPGDSAGSYTRSPLARELLGWRPTHSIEDGIRHALQWAAMRDAVLAPVSAAWSASLR